MTIKFECGNCGKQLSTSDDKAGKSGKCPDCGERVMVPSPATAAEEDDPFDFGELAAKLPPVSVGRSSRPSRSCPMCGAKVASSDRTCPACGEELGSASAERRGGFSTGNRVDIGEVFSVSWSRFQDQMGIAIAGFMVVVVISICIGAMLQVALIASEGNEVVAIFGQIANVLFSTWLNLGIFQFLLSIARGERAEVTQIFSGGRFFLRGILVNIIYLAVIFFGVGIPAALCIWLAVGANQGMIALILAVPTAIWAIYLAMSFIWALYVLVDTDVDSISSLKTSWELMSGNYLAVFVLNILAVFVVAGGYLMCCVGVIFTAPLAMVMQAVTYDHLTGGARRRPGDR